MEVELEAKWIVCDFNAVRSRLADLGAQLMESEHLMRRRPFDYPDNRLEQVGGWVRVRDEGNRITFSYKQLTERSLVGTQEVTVIVSNFDKMCELLTAIGLESKSYQETRREVWNLGACEVTLDTWPWIPPVVEIESSHEEELRLVAKALGFEWGQALFGSIENVYQRYYNVSESEVGHWPEIRFVPVPKWLEIKKKI